MLYNENTDLHFMIWRIAMKDAYTHNLSECETSVELLPALVCVLRFWWLILLTGLIFAIGTFTCLKLFVTPRYASQLKIYVDNRNMTNTYAEIIDGRTVFEQASAQISFPHGYEELCDMVTVSTAKETGIISVSVVTTDPLTSQMLAQAIADVAMGHVSVIVEGGSMQILEKPEIAAHPCTPRLLRNTIFGGTFGFIACICVIFLLYVLDINVNADTLSLRFGFPVFECIPAVSLSEENPENIQAIQEAYRALRTNVAFSLNSPKANCIAITCDDYLSDKCSISINLAVTFAQTDKKILLIDCDMQQRTLTRTLDMNARPGLSDFLIGNAFLADVIYSGVANVDILPAGRILDVPKMLMESSGIDLLVQRAREKYDYIFLDLASMNTAADAVVIARCTDGFLLVLRQNRTKNKAVREMLCKLELAGGKILGFIVHGSR